MRRRERLGALRWAAAIALTLIPARVQAGWNPAGVIVRSTARYIPLVAACEDGSGGTLVVWQEESSPGVGTLHAQHLGPNGDIAPTWPDTGIAVTGDATRRTQLGAIPDHAGGAYVWWVEPGRLVIQRVLFEGGQTAPSWPLTGRRFGIATAPDAAPHVVDDMSGGVYAAWLTASSTVGAIHLGPDAKGTGGWSNGPLVLSEPQSGEELAIWPQIAVAGDGGAFVAWGSMSFDTTLGPGRFRLRHVSASGGNVDPWPAEGLDFGPSDPAALPGSYVDMGSHIAIAPDDRGGVYVYVATSDSLWTSLLYRLTLDGASAPDWPVEGYSVDQGYLATTAPSYEAIANGLGGVAIGEPSNSICHTTFSSFRIFTGGDTSIAATVALDERHSVMARPDGRLFVTSDATWSSGIPCHYGGVWLGEIPVEPTWPGFSQYYTFGPTFGGIALAATPDSGVVLFWDQTSWPDSGLFARRFNGRGEVTFVPHTVWPARRATRLVLERARYVPGIGVQVRFGLPLGEGGGLELFDLQGRRVGHARVIGALGTIEATIPDTRQLGASVYFLRLRSGRESAETRVLVLRPQ